jgi:hypothetical protein
MSLHKEKTTAITVPFIPRYAVGFGRGNCCIEEISHHIYETLLVTESDICSGPWLFREEMQMGLSIVADFQGDDDERRKVEFWCVARKIYP